jgi:hypothetical protein
MPADSAWQPWLPVEPLLDEKDLLVWPVQHHLDDWPGWHTPDPVVVNLDHSDDASASSTSRPTSPSLLPSLPAPVLLTVAPIAEDDEDQFELGEKRVRRNEVTKQLRFWMERRSTPYVTLEEKKMIAKDMNISVAQVTNYINNFVAAFS